MKNREIKLASKQFHHLKSELIFYMGGAVSKYDPSARNNLVKAIIQAEYVVIYDHIVNEDNDYYIMKVGEYEINVSKSDRDNFAILKIKHGNDAKKLKKQRYNANLFVLVPEHGIAIVYNDEKRSSSPFSSHDWNMSSQSLNELCKKLDDFFIGINDSITIKPDRKFETQIIEPIKSLTEFEYRAELNQTFGENYIEYDNYKIVSSKAKEKIIEFYSSSFCPDDRSYTEDVKVEIETSEWTNNNSTKKLKGKIANRYDDIDGTMFTVIIYDQYDDNILLQNGKIYLCPDDLQKKVRERTIRDIERGVVQSKYMYSLFGIKKRNESNDDSCFYDVPDLEDFKKELALQAHKPNETQMEAIEKGIKAKDIQLVLGPPGTGKTTVIVNWIKYFISHGKRVLISSQNNSAVDNVLERVGNFDSARIIRVGRVEKVQDNCKQYLIDNQAETQIKQYKKSLGKSNETLDYDINNIESMINYAQSAITDFEDYKKCCDKIQEKANQISQQIAVLKELHSNCQKAYADYSEIYINKVHKDIAIQKLRKNRGIKALILRPVYKKISKIIRDINISLEQKIQCYISATNEYNNASKELYYMINNKAYTELKDQYKYLYAKCSNHNFILELKGPFKIDSFDVKSIMSSCNNPVIKVRSYINELSLNYYNLLKTKETLDDWSKSLDNSSTDIINKLLIEGSNIVGATCIGIKTNKAFSNLKFDVTIIDESGQIQIHNAIIPMTLSPVTLMLGDHLQIPPLANEEVKALCKLNDVPEKHIQFLSTSFFEWLFKKFEDQTYNSPHITRLNEQFRMPGVISDLISHWFYKGNYFARYDMKKWKPIISGTNSPLIVITTSNEDNRFESKDELEGGYTNVLEANISADIVNSLSEELFSNSTADSCSPNIGIISAYGKQVRLIRKMISQKEMDITPEQTHSIVSSLDSFQGQERPLIVYSCTRSADPIKVPPTRPRIGFLKELRRLNVAFTRCTKQLVIIGDFNYLTTCKYKPVASQTDDSFSNQSEEDFSLFMLKILNQAKEKGEFYTLKEFRERIMALNEQL